jgi:hypothetical protein
LLSTHREYVCEESARGGDPPPRVAMGKSKKNAKKKGNRVANPMSEPLSPMSPMENPLIEVERVQEVDSSDDDEVQSRARDREAAKPPLPTRSDTPFPLGSAPGSMPRPHILGPRRSRTSLKMRGWDALPRTWRSCVLVIVPLRASLCAHSPAAAAALTRSARP